MISRLKIIGFLLCLSASPSFCIEGIVDACFRDLRSIDFNPALSYCSSDNLFNTSIIPSPFGINELKTVNAQLVHKFGINTFGGLSVSNYGFDLYKYNKIKAVFAKEFFPKINIGVSLDYINEFYKNYSSVNSYKCNFGAYYQYSKLLDFAFSMNNINIYENKSVNSYSGFNIYLSARAKLDSILAVSATVKELSDYNSLYLNFYYKIINNISCKLGYSTNPKSFDFGLDLNLYDSVILFTKFEYTNLLGFSSLFGIGFGW